MRKFRLQRRWYLLFPAIGLAVLVLVAFFLFWSPIVDAVSPKTESAIDFESDIVVSFSKPVNRRHLIPTISPDIDGTWTYEGARFSRHFFQTIRFQPDRPFEPGTTYAVTIEGLTDVLALGPETTYRTSFVTTELPKVTGVTPEAESNNLSPQTRIEVTLDRPTGSSVLWRPVFEPEIESSLTVSDSRDSFAIVPKQPFSQGVTYSFTLERLFVTRDRVSDKVVSRSDPVEQYQGTFSIAPPPKLDSVLPAGKKVFVSEKPIIVFSEPMRESTISERFTIDPPVAGKLALSEDHRTLTYTPDGPLAYATPYTVRLAKGAETESGGFIIDATEYSFTTIGAVKVKGTVPDDGSAGIQVGTSMRITFDQDVDEASAEASVSFVPPIETKTSWKGRTLILQPMVPLAHSTLYRVQIAKGVKSVNGLPSKAEVSITFQTVDETTRLAITIDYQDRPLSCEAAALKMALAGKGVRVSEGDIMALISTNPAHRQGNIWGNPFVEFVGDINGRQNTTGYGVYWGPIAVAASRWRPAEAFTGWTVPKVTAEIAAGNPVVAWGVYGNGYEDDWTTSDGKNIDAWKGEHARTIIGFVGTPDNPSKFIINDPYAGQITWTRAQFERDWAKFGNAGVVVR